MKKFIFRTILFLCVLLGVISTFYWYWFSQPNEKVTISKKNIVIGDSNTRWSVDDKILSSYSNYSTGGEVYLFAYRKLKLITSNNKIDTLLLSFGPHNIINNMWWDDSEGTPLNNRMPAFFKDFSGEEHLDFIFNTPRNYLKSILKIGKSEITNFFIFQNNKNQANRNYKLGFYLPNPQNETQHIPKFYGYQSPKITEIEIKYLNKIIEECKAKNIYLVLIQPPKNYLREDFKNYMQKEFYDYYQKHYSHIDFLDFSLLKLPPHAYWDVMHVDIVGAEYFSSFLNKNGIKNLLKSKYNLRSLH